MKVLQLHPLDQKSHEEMYCRIRTGEKSPNLHKPLQGFDMQVEEATIPRISGKCKILSDE